MTDTRKNYICQAAAETAFAKYMGWSDWTPEEESEEGMVRGHHVQWRPETLAFVVPDDAEDDDIYVVVTGEPAVMKIHGWMTAGKLIGSDD